MTSGRTRAAFPSSIGPVGPVLQSAANAEFAHQRTVAIDVLLGQIVQQPTPPSDLHQESTPRVVVMLVNLEVLGQRVDRRR